MDTDLQADLARSLEPPPEDAPPPLDPLDEDRANRMLFKVRRLARDRARVQAVARAERDRVDAWERDRLESLDREIGDVTATLEAWMRMHSERTGAVTKKFPNGELRLRPARVRLDVIDDEKASGFAIERVMTAIARNLADEAFRDRRLTSADVWSLAFSHAMAEPFLRLKLELAKDEIKRAAKEGDLASEHDDVEMRRAVLGEGDERELIPGVLFEKDRRKAFGMTLATAAAQELGEDVPEPDPGELEEVDRG